MGGNSTFVSELLANGQTCLISSGTVHVSTEEAQFFLYANVVSRYKAVMLAKYMKYSSHLLVYIYICLFVVFRLLVRSVVVVASVDVQHVNYVQWVLLDHFVKFLK